MFPLGLFISDISEIDVNALDFDVRVYQTKEKEQVYLPLGTSITFTKNKIRINQTQTKEELTKLNPNKKPQLIKLYLSKKTLEYLTIVTQSGLITIEDLALPNTCVTLRTDNGPIVIRDTAFEKLRVKGQDLKLNVRDIQIAKEGIVVFQKSKVKLKKVVCHTIKIEGRKGVVELDQQSSFHELNSRIDSGYFKAEQVRGDKMNIKIKKQGSIRVERSILEALRAKTNDGRILVSLPNNFRYGTIELSSDRSLEGILPDHTKNEKVLVLTSERGPIQFR